MSGKARKSSPSLKGHGFQTSDKVWEGHEFTRATKYKKGFSPEGMDAEARGGIQGLRALEFTAQTEIRTHR